MKKKQIVVLGGGIAGIEFLVRITKRIDHSKYALSQDKNLQYKKDRVNKLLYLSILSFNINEAHL